MRVKPFLSRIFFSPLGKELFERALPSDGPFSQGGAKLGNNPPNSMFYKDLIGLFKVCFLPDLTHLVLDSANLSQIR